MFLWRTFAFTTTTVMGVSAAFYIGNFLTKSMIRDSSENVDSDDEVESVEDEFECRYDIDFKALDKKVAPPKEIVKNYVSTVDTPIGDVVMTYDVDSDTFIYYSERRTIPIRFLDTVCKKFVIEHDCKVFYKEENVEVEEENGGLGQAPEAQLSNEVALSSQEDGGLGSPQEPYYMRFWNSYFSSSEPEPQGETVEPEPEPEPEPEQEPEVSVFATFKNKKVPEKTNDSSGNKEIVKIMNKYKCGGTVNDYENNKKKEEVKDVPVVTFAKFKEIYKNKTE